MMDVKNDLPRARDLYEIEVLCLTLSKHPADSTNLQTFTLNTTNNLSGSK